MIGGYNLCEHGMRHPICAHCTHSLSGRGEASKIEINCVRRVKAAIFIGGASQLTGYPFKAVNPAPVWNNHRKRNAELAKYEELAGTGLGAGR